MKYGAKYGKGAEVVPPWLERHSMKIREDRIVQGKSNPPLDMSHKAPGTPREALPPPEPEPEPELPFGAGLRIRAQIDKRSAAAANIWAKRRKAIGWRTEQAELDDRPPHISRVTSALEFKHEILCGFHGLDADWHKGRGGHLWTRDPTHSTPINQYRTVLTPEPYTPPPLTPRGSPMKNPSPKRPGTSQGFNPSPGPPRYPHGMSPAHLGGPMDTCQEVQTPTRLDYSSKCAATPENVSRPRSSGIYVGKATRPGPRYHGGKAGRYSNNPFPKGEGGRMRELYARRKGKHPIPKRDMEGMGVGDQYLVQNMQVPGRGVWWATLRPYH